MVICMTCLRRARWAEREAINAWVGECALGRAGGPHLQRKSSSATSALGRRAEDTAGVAAPGKALAEPGREERAALALLPPLLSVPLLLATCSRGAAATTAAAGSAGVETALPSPPPSILSESAPAEETCAVVPRGTDAERLKTTCPAASFPEEISEERGRGLTARRGSPPLTLLVLPPCSCGARTPGAPRRALPVWSGRGAIWIVACV